MSGIVSLEYGVMAVSIGLAAIVGVTVLQNTVQQNNDSMLNQVASSPSSSGAGPIVGLATPSDGPQPTDTTGTTESITGTPLPGTTVGSTGSNPVRPPLNVIGASGGAYELPDGEIVLGIPELPQIGGSVDTSGGALNPPPRNGGGLSAAGDVPLSGSGLGSGLGIITNSGNEVSGTVNISQAPGSGLSSLPTAPVVNGSLFSDGIDFQSSTP